MNRQIAAILVARKKVVRKAVLHALFNKYKLKCDREISPIYICICIVKIYVIIEGLMKP